MWVGGGGPLVLKDPPLPGFLYSDFTRNHTVKSTIHTESILHKTY